MLRFCIQRHKQSVSFVIGRISQRNHLLSFSSLFSSDSKLSEISGNDKAKLSKTPVSQSSGTSPEEAILSYLQSIPVERIRNFSIIAHVDHGKSTLADRLLEITSERKVKHAQLLDSLAVERERGITVKSSTATMVYIPSKHGSRSKTKQLSSSATAGPGTGSASAVPADVPYLINMVDTPGHVDFQFEVQRALGSCQGALLLVDSSQGVQAQTISNYRIAKEVGLTIIPCLTKLDLPHSDPARCIEQLKEAFGYEEDEILWCSAKTGEGVEDILPSIVKKIPCPPIFDESHVIVNDQSNNTSNNNNSSKSDSKKQPPSRALIVDSWHDRYQGVVCLLNILCGKFEKGMDIALSSAPGKMFKVQEVGVLTPKSVETPELTHGHVGYLLAHIKETKDARVGEHVCSVSPTNPVPTFPGSVIRMSPMHARSRAKLFASVYPADMEDFNDLKKSMERLALNDASVFMHHESSGALGQGFRCGFLGMLHMEVFFQRLRDDFGTEAITTAPTVPYQAKMKPDGRIFQIEKAADLPEKHLVLEYLEPMVKATVVVPQHYLGQIISIFADRRSEQIEVKNTDTDMILTYLVPWADAVTDLFDHIKSVTSGYATLDFEDAPYRQADIVKVDILLNGEMVEPLSFVCHKTVAEHRGRAVALKLKEEIPMQQFEVAIQAAVGTKIIAKERIKAMRKDVLTKSGKTVGGGDKSRKMKLLQKQKEGKKKLKTVGKVQLSQKAFHAVLAR